MQPTHELENRATTTHLRGHWLFMARATWLGLAVLSLGLVVLSIPARWNELRYVSPTVVVIPLHQLSIEDAAALQQLGLSVDFYALYVLALELLPIFFSALLALIIFWRKSDEWMTLLISLLLVLGGPPTTSFIAFSVFLSQPAWRWLISLILGLALSLFLVMFYLFPDGRVVPQRSWPLAVVSPILILASFGFFLNNIFSFVSTTGWSRIDFVALFSNPRILWPILLVDVPFYGSISFGMVAQVYRYVRQSNAMQRQQTKWVVFGLAATLLSIIVIAVSLYASLTQFGRTGLLATLVSLPLAVCLLMVFPLSIAFSILRYRLWDIDVIINRTLVYGTLTVALALVYIGSVVLLQQLLSRLTAGSDVATVATTLVIAALFQPLRRRIQNVIDKRFHRRK